jgi:glycosyltransferase involved in cell wall biosynthesis
MNILLISRGYPSKRDPQWGSFEKDQALALQAIGHKVIIMSVEVQNRFRRRKLGISHHYENGLNVYSIYFPLIFFHLLSKKWKIILRQKFGLILYKKIEKRQGSPDILYVHYMYNIAGAVAIKNKYNIPLVGIEHWSILDQKKISQFDQYRGNIAYSGADKIIVVSDSLRNQILYHFNKDSIVIHNMIGGEFLNQNFKIKKEFNAPIKYVAIGILIQRKGFDVLIAAFSKSDLKEKGVVVTIIGEGSERSELQKQINNVGLSDNIFLVGIKSKLEIIEILDDSDVFVFPSRSENFSVAVLEVLSRGLPVIATICGGIRECIDDSNGLLVPVDDVDAFTDAMQKMYHTYMDYDKKMIAERCRQQFSPSVIAKKLTQVFEEVIEIQN